MVSQKGWIGLAITAVAKYNKCQTFKRESHTCTIEGKTRYIIREKRCRKNVRKAVEKKEEKGRKRRSHRDLNSDRWYHSRSTEARACVEAVAFFGEQRDSSMQRVKKTSRSWFE